MSGAEISHEWLSKFNDKLSEAHPAFFAVDPRNPTEIHFFKDRTAFRDWIRSLNEIEATHVFVGHTAETITSFDPDEDDTGSEDPCLAWCIENAEIFRDHDPAFVAVDIKKARIVLSDSDEDTFKRKLAAFGDDEKSALFITHTSNIVG